jgi:hypothetical protein
MEIAVTLFNVILLSDSGFCANVFCGNVFCTNVFCGNVFCANVFCANVFCANVFCDIPEQGFGMYGTGVWYVWNRGLVCMEQGFAMYGTGVWYVWNNVPERSTAFVLIVGKYTASHSRS